MVRSKQCFSVVRNIIWLACTGFCLLLTPSEMLAETVPMPPAISHNKLLPVPPGYGCPENALSCVASEDPIKFYPGEELSLPARFLMRSPDELIPVYYLNKKNSDDDKTLPENVEAVQYLKARFEIMTSKNIIVITPAEAGTWKLLRLAKLTYDTWGSIQNSILIRKGDVAVLQNDRGSLTLNVQHYGENRPANGVIIDSEGLVFRGDDALWLRVPQDGDRDNSCSSSEVTAGKTYAASVTSRKPSQPCTPPATRGATQGGDDDDDGDDRKRRPKNQQLDWFYLDDIGDEELMKKPRRQLIGLLKELPRNKKAEAERIVRIIVAANKKAPKNQKLAAGTIESLMETMREFRLDLNKELMNTVDKEKNARR